MLDQDDKWFSVTLRISGDELDLPALEPLLGLRPTRLCVKGQARGGLGRKKHLPNRTNVWSHSVALPSETGFDEQIRALFVSLGDRVERLRALCQTEGVRAELFCGFGSGNGQGGDVIAASTLGLLADTGLALSLDLYPPDVDTAVDG